MSTVRVHICMQTKRVIQHFLFTTVYFLQAYAEMLVEDTDQPPHGIITEARYAFHILLNTIECIHTRWRIGWLCPECTKGLCLS